MREFADGQVVMCPGEGIALPTDPPDTAEAMAAMMHRQIAWAARNKPDMLPGFGGHIVTAHVTRDEIALRKAPLVGLA